jgi:hypothetical protein
MLNDAWDFFSPYLHRPQGEDLQYVQASLPSTPTPLTKGAGKKSIDPSDFNHVNVRLNLTLGNQSRPVSHYLLHLRPPPGKTSHRGRPSQN